MDEETAPVRTTEASDDPAAPVRPCLIVLSGHTIGRVYPLESDVVIGRSSSVEISIEIPGVSRRHAKITGVESGGYLLTDLGSKNGTFVEGVRVDEHRLVNGERFQLGAATVLKFSLQTAVEEAFQNRLYKSAVHDHLTQAFNRRYFDDHLAREISHVRRHKTPMSLLLLDIDHFKKINDKYGHLSGDKALEGLGGLVNESVRHEDVFCRIGGEEFAVIMRDTDEASAVLLAERLRTTVEKRTFQTPEGELQFTVSMGVSTFDPDRHTSAAHFVETTDRALYEAKRTGRNRVHVA